MRNLLHTNSGVQHTCRFVPTCSGYAMQAIETHGVFCGLWLATKRLLKCHPWGKGGLDLVPPIQEFRRS
ncbi:membrane protein insertion efficiency factor YidD [bacterium]|nr:membrane protein insertion efficiency factor YidD [bacterium]NBX83882.1 membrane protein insertion efficiency factor YidD [bacterium]